MWTCIKVLLFLIYIIVVPLRKFPLVKVCEDITYILNSAEQIMKRQHSPINWHQHASRIHKQSYLQKKIQLEKVIFLYKLQLRMLPTVHVNTVMITYSVHAHYVGPWTVSKLIWQQELWPPCSTGHFCFQICLHVYKWLV